MQPVIIKKYANRKLYVTKGNTEPSGYLNLQGLIDIIKKGKDVKIVDNVSGDDLTADTLKLCLEYVTLSSEVLTELIRGKDGSSSGNI